MHNFLLLISLIDTTLYLKNPFLFKTPINSRQFKLPIVVALNNLNSFTYFAIKKKPTNRILYYYDPNKYLKNFKQTYTDYL